MSNNVAIDTTTETDLAGIIDQLIVEGYVVLPDFFPTNIIEELHDMALQHWNSGEFHVAGVGRGQELNVNESIRGDHVQWLEPTSTGALAAFQGFMEEMRVALNRELYLGLFEFESHFAVYPPGTFYRRHLDNFRGTSSRMVTSVLYLNKGWNEGDCGQLRLYKGESCSEYFDIFPHGGQVVLFMSNRFWHEVLPARRERFSLTGWLRQRDAT